MKHIILLLCIMTLGLFNQQCRQESDPGLHHPVETAAIPSPYHKSADSLPPAHDSTGPAAVDPDPPVRDGDDWLNRHY